MPWWGWLCVGVGGAAVLTVGFVAICAVRFIKDIEDAGEWPL